MCAIRSVLRGARPDHVHGRLLLPVGVVCSVALRLRKLLHGAQCHDRSFDIYERSGGAQAVWRHTGGDAQLGDRTQVHAFSVCVVYTLRITRCPSHQNHRFAGNFAYDAGAGVADLLQSFYPSAALADCTACFKCRFPEIRLIWWIVASTISIASPSSFRVFSGNVSQNCMGARLDPLTCATSPRCTRPGERSGRRAVRVWWRCPSRPG